MKAAQKRKNKKINKAYDIFKNEVAVVFQKQYLVDDEGNTYLRETPVGIGRRVNNSQTDPLPPPDQIQKQSKGVAIEVVHFFLDELWNFGSQKLNISEECTKTLIKNADGSTPVAEEKKEKAIAPNTEAEKNTLQESQVDQEETKTEQVDTQATVVDEEEKVEEDTNSMSPADMDELIKKSFIMLCVRHIKDTDMPLEPSQLQGEYLHKFEHKEHGKIDFKKSNYKKVTKFCRKMKQQKFISFEKPKGMDHEIITEINRKSSFIVLPFRY